MLGSCVAIVPDTLTSTVLTQAASWWRSLAGDIDKTSLRSIQQQHFECVWGLDDLARTSLRYADTVWQAAASIISVLSKNSIAPPFKYNTPTHCQVHKARRSHSAPMALLSIAARTPPRATCTCKLSPLQCLEALLQIVQLRRRRRRRRRPRWRGQAHLLCGSTHHRMKLAAVRSIKHRALRPQTEPLAGRRQAPTCHEVSFHCPHVLDAWHQVRPRHREAVQLAAISGRRP